MKKTFFVVLAGILFSSTSFAQKGDITFGGGGDLGFPTGEFGNYFKAGFGVYGKTMLGVGKAGHVTFTSGYSGFKLKTGLSDQSTTVNIVPFLFGYRHNFNSFFVEPQVGYSVMGLKVMSEEEGAMTEGAGLITWAASAGYVFNNHVEVSARYQSGSKNGSSVSVFGLRLGYNFSLGHSK
jgi:hypothetical protein